MSIPSSYKTKQREDILSYLRTTQGTHVTPAHVREYFVHQGQSISLATIYRQLERLTEEGLVNKYHLAHENGACFEYIDRDNQCSETLCFHCKCEVCGTLIHLECHDMVGMQSHMKETHGFTLNPIRTVFYGTCQECTEQT